MSKLFFDHLLDFKKLDRAIKKIAKTKEEKEEIWVLVDEIVHHKAMGCILDKLHHHHHEEFLEMFHQNPHDEELLFSYLKGKIGENIELILKEELGNLAFDLLKETKSPGNLPVD
jgi:hypothetical protein